MKLNKETVIKNMLNFILLDQTIMKNQAYFVRNDKEHGEWYRVNLSPETILIAYRKCFQHVWKASNSCTTLTVLRRNIV